MRLTKVSAVECRETLLGQRHHDRLQVPARRARLSARYDARHVGRSPAGSGTLKLELGVKLDARDAAARQTSAAMRQKVVGVTRPARAGRRMRKRVSE